MKQAQLLQFLVAASILLAAANGQGSQTELY